MAFVPVVERGGGRVVGVLRFQDVYLKPTPNLASLLLSPARLPRRMALAEAVVELRRAQAPIGIIEDGGRPIGMVSMADLLAPLTGIEPAYPVR